MRPLSKYCSFSPIQTKPPFSLKSLGPVLISLFRLVELPEPSSDLTDSATVRSAAESDHAGPSRTEDQVDRYERRKVPLTILTGYLGAGKSTLLE